MTASDRLLEGGAALRPRGGGAPDIARLREEREVQSTMADRPKLRAVTGTVDSRPAGGDR